MEDGIPFYRRLSFKFLASGALFIALIEAVLLVFSIQGMQRRLLSIRQTVVKNLSGDRVIPPENVLSSPQISEIVQQYAQNIIVMVAVIVAVVVTGLYFVIRYWFLSPLQEILEKNQHTIAGDLEYIEEDDIPGDEIGLIMRSRNEMLNTINTLYNEEALETLCQAVDAKDEYTEGHSRRVGQIGSLLGERLGLDRDACERLEHSGSLHDIGKIGLDDTILTKDGSLTDEEFEKVMEHPVRGEKIIQFSNMHTQILHGIRYHHEQYDGSGYPDGLEGDEIPLFGRILAVADAMDAMLSDRHYRNALSFGEVEYELEENKESQFDPEIAHEALTVIQPENRSTLPDFPAGSTSSVSR